MQHLEFLKRTPAYIAPRSILVAASLLILSFGLCSCRTAPSTSSASATHSRPLTIIVFDRSGSTEFMRSLQTSCAQAALARAGQWGENASIYVLDSKLACVRQASPARRGELISDYVKKQLQTPSDARANKTRPALLWKLLVEQFANDNSGRIVRILFLTDGDNDWPKDKDEISNSVATLAKNSNVYVAMCGLEKDQQKSVSKQLNALGEHIHFSVGNDKEQMFKCLGMLREDGGGNSK